MAVSSFTAIGSMTQLLTRTGSGPDDAGGGDAGDWPDDSGSNDAVPADAPNPPGYVANPLGDGTGPGALVAHAGGYGYSSGEDLSGYTDATMFICVNITGFTGTYSNYLTDDSGDGDEWNIYSESGNDIYFWDGSSATFIENAVTGIATYVAVKDDTTLRIYKQTENATGVDATANWDERADARGLADGRVQPVPPGPLLRQCRQR